MLSILQLPLYPQVPQIDSILFCPHHPSDNCECRKPRSGMLKQAASDMGVDFSMSYVVGDSITDLVSGLNVGCKTILVRTGYGNKEFKKINTLDFSPNYVADDLKVATEWIMNDTSKY